MIKFLWGDIMPSVAGRRIKEIRERQDISQNRLAKLSGVSQSAISAIESETKSPTLDTIERIAEALHCSVADIMNEKKEPTPLGELQMQNVSLLTQLSPQEIQRVRDFAQGLIAARSVTDSPRK